jgi:phosphoserine phosphatase
MKDKSHVIVTVSGKDKPGITAAFAQAIARHHAEIVDIDQATVHNILALSLLLDISHSNDDPDLVLRDLLFEANHLGMTLEYQQLSAEEIPDRSAKNLYILTVFGGTRALAEISTILGDDGVNIDEIANVGDQMTPCVELTVDVRNPEKLTRLKDRLMTRSHELDIDFAIQRADAYRKSKRLVIFDMDRTLVTTEIIDEMARAAGCHDTVRRVTEKSMRGDLDFADSLRQRTAMLKGLEIKHLEQILDGVQLSGGVPELINTLKRQGFRIGIVSGGFDFFARALEKRLGLDFAYANSLEIVNGKLTGRVNGSIIDDQAKATILTELSDTLGVPLDQTVAIGDGANDRLMLGRAGLGIAYNAHKSVALSAVMSVGRERLKHILYTLGISNRDILS